MNSNSHWYIGFDTTEIGYFNWAANEPNNSPSGLNSWPREICNEVRMLTTIGSGSTLRGGLNDNDCRKKNHYMCVLDDGACSPLIHPATRARLRALPQTSVARPVAVPSAFG
jgi:hypothetical protein